MRGCEREGRQWCPGGISGRNRLNSGMKSGCVPPDTYILKCKGRVQSNYSIQYRHGIYTFEWVWEGNCHVVLTHVHNSFSIGIRFV